MPYAIDTYTGDGATDTFNVTFPYLAESDVTVYVDGVLQVDPTHYSFISSTQIQFVTAPASAEVISIIRATDLSNSRYDFSDGSAIREDDLDGAHLQKLYAIQELIDGELLLPGRYSFRSAELSGLAVSFSSADVAVSSVQVAEPGVFRIEAGLTLTNSTHTNSDQVALSIYVGPNDNIASDPLIETHHSQAEGDTAGQTSNLIHTVFHDVPVAANDYVTLAVKSAFAGSWQYQRGSAAWPRPFYGYREV